MAGLALTAALVITSPRSVGRIFSVVNDHFSSSVKKARTLQEEKPPSPEPQKPSLSELITGYHGPYFNY